MTGNCLRCHSNGYSPGLGMNVILGISTTRSEPTILHSSSLLLIARWNIRRVPLQRPCRGFIFLSSISGIPGLRSSMCWGNPFGFNVFKYSVLNRKASAGFSNVSALLSLTPVSGRLPCITLFIVSTSLSLKLQIRTSILDTGKGSLFLTNPS